MFTHKAIIQLQSHALAHPSHKRFCLRIIYTCAHTEAHKQCSWSPYRSLTTVDASRHSLGRQHILVEDSTFRTNCPEANCIISNYWGKKKQANFLTEWNLNSEWCFWITWTTFKTILLTARFHISRQFDYVTWKRDKAHSGDIKLWVITGIGIMERINFTESLPLLLNTTAISKF